MATPKELYLDDDGCPVGRVLFTVDLNAQIVRPKPAAPKAERLADDPEEVDDEAEAESAPDPVAPTSFDPKTNEIDVLWYGGETVERNDFWTGERWLLTLSMDPKHTQRLERLNDRAPFVNSHWTHSVDDVLGVFVPGSVRIEGMRGIGRVRLSPAPQDAGRVMKIATGIAAKASVGVRIHKSEVTEAEAGRPKHVLATDWEPDHVGSVPIGASPSAGTLSADASQAIPEALPPEPANEGADMAPETEKAELERKAALAERARLTDIGRHKVRWQLSDEQEAALVESNLSGAELGNRVLDIVADRDEATAISSFSDAATSYVEAGTTEHQKRASTVEEYILHLGWPHRKNPLTGKESGFKMTDGARQWSGYTMADLAREDRRCRGLSWKGLLPHQLEDMALIPITSEVPDDFQRFGGEGGGGMSPTDLPAAFGNVITKTLQASFSLKMKTYEVWTDRMVLPDFKQADIVKLGSAAQLLDVSDDGEYTYGYIGDRKERIWLVTGGRVVPVGRRFQVDDSLGILVSLPRRFGPNAKIRRNKMVYKLFFDNEVMLSTGLPMFDPGHANVIGAGAGVEASFADDASVGAMWDLVRQQRDQPAPGEEKGNKIDLVPEYIIHPSRQFQAWRKYLGRTNPTTTDEVVLEEYKGLRLLDEPELDDNDPNAWYMAVGADTGHAGVMTATLLGQGDGPQVMWKMGWNPRGVEMMISDDFGARPNEQRGIYRNAGA